MLVGLLSVSFPVFAAGEAELPPAGLLLPPEQPASKDTDNAAMTISGISFLL